jgi:RibD C-terminal domain
MRRVVLQMGVTLDGYVSGPGGEGDWGLPAEHPDVRAWKVASLGQVGTHIMGRVTYEQMAAHWPTAAGDYAAFMNKLPKVVFSKTLPTAEWAGSRIARGVVILPVALGNGLPLFKDLAKPLRVDLAEARSFPDGTVIHVYQPIRTTG